MEGIQGTKKSYIKELGVSFMPIFSNPRLNVLVIIFLLFAPTMAFGEDGEGNNTAVTLGWLAIGLGIVGNLSLMIFKIASKTVVLKLVSGYENTQSLAPFYTPILNFHIMLNSIGFFAGLSHGFMLIGGLDAISLSLAIIMTISMISGVILKYASDRHLKFFGRLVHGQFILAILMITLVILHVITHGGNFE